MKFVNALLVLCCLGFSGYSQVLISPTGAGGFELGTTLGTNGWIGINPATAANQWVVGSAAGTSAGSYCAYISNNAGISYTYNNSVARTAHFYRDVVIPPSSVSITLSFDWKGFGESGVDQMLVYTAPTSVTPVSNSPVSPSTVIAGATLVWTQPSAAVAGFTPATIPLPASLAGTTVRLIFTWENDGSLGTTPGGALDNISLTYVCSVPQPIAGPLSLCTGTTSSLTDPTAFGAWSSSATAVGTISSSGVVSGLTGGTTTISYSVTGCLSPATAVVTVVAPPAAISGPSSVCIGSTATLGETSLGGTWSSSLPGTVSVSTTGDIFGAALGTANISYINGCGAPAVTTITVSPLPAPISLSVTHVCGGGGTMTVSDATLGGTWSASPPANATAATTGPGTGTVTGVAGGIADVTYTSALGCIATAVVTIDPVPSAIIGAVPICAGNYVVLTDLLPGGTWSSSITGVATVGSSSGLVTGLAGGTTIISYTNTCGSATVVFTVNAYPGPIIGDDSICIGNTTALADMLIGGTWSSSNPAVASVLTTSGLVTGIAIGTTLITYSMAGGCNTLRMITVLDVPGPVTGTMQMCPLANVTLTHPISGGTWSSANPVVGTVGITSGIVTGLHADTVHIIYTTPAGCAVYAIVTVNPLPDTIVGNEVLCVLTATTLYDASAGGTWASLTPALASIGASSGLVSPLFTGTANFKYTLPTGCSISKSFAIKPLPVPVVSFNNHTNTIYTDTGFSTYQWYHNVLGTVVGATSNHTLGLHNGKYYVIVSDANGCVGTSGDFSYVLTMGVGAASNNDDVLVYPNPAGSILYVTSGHTLQAVISGIDGRVLIDQKDARQIDLSRLAKGVYTVTLYNDDGIKIKVASVVKQ